MYFPSQPSKHRDLLHAFTPLALASATMAAPSGLISKSMAFNYRKELETGTFSRYEGKDLPRSVRNLTEAEIEHRKNKLEERLQWLAQTGRGAYKTKLTLKLSKILGNTEDIKEDATTIKKDTTAIKKDTEDLEADTVAIKTKLEKAKNDIMAATRTEDKKKKDAKEEHNVKKKQKG